MPVDYAPVYGLVREVPAGSVASYGMIASLLPGVTARMVGRALGQLKEGTRVPWHRILNASGAIAPRSSAGKQRDRLAKEGVTFKKNGHVHLRCHLWEGPSQAWIDLSGMDPHDAMEILSGWRRK